eukprot:MONOS_16387.1-p1 / transcript=MONOS_16387.1 / gene=MONOS_16387 / organism=Monocercomonoides_exilis_PA203 / gene_product=unspecified product / transcript_product=unspecified product / location=Mono_scaffold01698:232-1462(-) / protein_length=233 / sequence_SO=supercontig / SO=protein_coding / is_pseudo=false
MEQRGSLGEVWDSMKDQVTSVEKSASELSQTFKEMFEFIEKESKEYLQQWNQAERALFGIKKKREDIVEEVNKKKEKYHWAFREWDESEWELDNAQKDQTTKPDKLLKLQKATQILFSSQSAAESSYREAIAACKKIEAETAVKEKEVLEQMERLETQRMQSQKTMLVSFYAAWEKHLLFSSNAVRECLTKCDSIDIGADLDDFSSSLAPSSAKSLFQTQHFEEIKRVCYQR